MFNGIIQELSLVQILKFILYFGMLLSMTWIIKKIVILNARKNAEFNEKFVPALNSMVNWISFYGSILLFLFTFSDSKWIFYPLYTLGDVDVTIFLMIIAIMIVSLAHRLVKLFTKYILSSVYEYYGVDKGLGYTFNQMIYYTVMFAAFAVSFTSVGIDLTALGAIVGVLGIGIGFGMRNVAGNFVSGIIILFERPIEVGEVIQINDKIGRVEKIRLRSTVIRTAKEGTLIVPNQYFIEEIIKNRTSAEMMAQVEVSVVYGSDTKFIQEILEIAVTNIKQRTNGILEFPSPDIRLIDFRLKSLDFLIEIPVTNFEVKERVESHLRHEIARLFIEKEIQVPGVEIEMVKT